MPQDMKLAANSSVTFGRRGRCGVWAAVTFAIMTLPAAAIGQPSLQPTPTVGVAKWDFIVRRLMDQGRLVDAMNILDARLIAAPRDVQARFLKGLIAVAKKDHRSAIRDFRSILIDQPDATRVRLELARAFYLAKEYGNAMRQFQFALAGNPPVEVAANIKRYMAAIRQAKSLSYTFALSIAPDSNLNTGSSARELSLFGLPFDLSDEARQRSGVGLAIEMGGEWAPKIGKGKRLRLGVSGQRREYRGTDADDMTISAFAGPRLVTGKWDLSLLGTANRRWFGAKPYNQAKGARLEATYYLSPELGISGAAGVQWVSHRLQKARNGRLVTLNAAAFHALSASSALTVKGGVGRQHARADAYSNWNGFIAAGYFKELSLGFSAYVEPSVSLARYDEALLGFADKRVDRSATVLIALLNRHIVLDRFTPRISYVYTRQHSSIPLFTFERSRIEIGLTTTF